MRRAITRRDGQWRPGPARQRNKGYPVLSPLLVWRPNQAGWATNGQLFGDEGFSMEDLGNVLGADLDALQAQSVCPFDYKPQDFVRSAAGKLASDSKAGFVEDVVLTEDTLPADPGPADPGPADPRSADATGNQSAPKSKGEPK